MHDMPWNKVYEAIELYVVRIATPSGSGTGFLVSRTNGNLIAIATAAHVLNHAHYWEQPIRIKHFATGKSVLLRQPDRAVFLEEDRDTAALVFDVGELELPSTPPLLSPEGKYLKVGLELAWVGSPDSPAVASVNLCFFSGRVSAHRTDKHTYLVDGVAINGVSGGPAFWNGGNRLSVIGVVSAYIPNRASGIVLPGLSIIRDVSQFHDITKKFESLDKARSKQSPPQEPPPAESIDSPQKPTSLTAGR
jgi:hypothetical protein